MSATFEMPLDARKGCLELAKEMLLVAEGLEGVDHLKSLVAKMEASMDSPTVTLESGEIAAMLALGDCSELIVSAKGIRKLLKSMEEKPELSQGQVISFATLVLQSAPEDQRDSYLYEATMSLLTTTLKHTGGGLMLTPEGQEAYMAIKRMYYAGGFNEE